MARARLSRAAVRFSVLLLLAVGLLGSATRAALPLIRPTTSADSKARLAESYGKLPLSFEANEGQTDPDVKFLARGPGYGLVLKPTEAVLKLLNVSGPDVVHHTHEIPSSSASKVTADRPLQHSRQQFTRKGEKSTAIRMTLIDADPSAQISAMDEMPAKVNYLKGNDPAKWRTGIPTYGKVKFSQIYRGVDLVYYGNQRQLEYDFVVAPGADPKTIRMKFETVGEQGEDSLKPRLEANGDLLLAAGGGEVRFKKPLIYQNIGGRRREVAGQFILNPSLRPERMQGGATDLVERNHSHGEQEQQVEIGFQLATYDTTQPVIIDPIVVFATYFGGSNTDYGRDIAVDNNGNAYITGSTVSWTGTSDFPTVNALYTRSAINTDSDNTDSDAFIVKLNSTGSDVLYSTYLGGGRNDYGNAITVDVAGNAYVTGYTESANFPTANAIYPAFLGTSDAFVIKLNSDGSQAVYSTYLGGSGGESGSDIAVDSAGSVYLTGATSSLNFPVVNALYPQLRGSSDAFAVKFNSIGSQIIASTYVGGSVGSQDGGSGWDVGTGIAVDADGNVYLTGYTSSSDFPTISARYPQLGGSYDAFVAKFSSDLSQVIYSTYVGGSGSEHGEDITVDVAGNAYVTGYTESANFPTANAIYPAFRGDLDAFVIKLNTDGSQVLYSTYLGGSRAEWDVNVAVDSAANVYITGTTTSSDFPKINTLYPSTGQDIFVVKVNNSGSAIEYSTLLGGSKGGVSGSIALDGKGNVYVTGSTFSNDFPSLNAIYPSFQGSSDAFIAKISANTLPSTTTYGVSLYTGSAAEPVNTATGNYYYQHTDLKLPGRGLPFAFTRTYNDQDSYSGPLGRGWTHSYNVRLTEQADGSAVIKQGDGHEEFYEPNGDGSYSSRYPGLYSRLAKNADNSFTLTAKDQTRQTFDDDGHLSAIADQNGNALSFAYDGAGNLIAITDTVGRTLSLSYDADHRLVQLTDPIGRTVHYAYDAEGHLISDTDPLGAVLTYAYDAGHHVTTITDRRGHTLIENTYDGEGRVVSQKNGRGFVTTFAYDSPSLGDTTITDPLGHATIHTHDGLRRLVKETDGLGHAIQYAYDAQNNRTQVTDRNGNVTKYTYDTRGNVTTKTDAKGQVTTITYDELNNPTQRTDALGGTTTFVYDSHGNLTQVTDPLGHTREIAYDTTGQPVTLTDALSQVTTQTFDAHGNVIKVTDSLGQTTAYAYDGAGRRIGRTDANGSVTAFVYDANDRLVETTDPLGHTTQFRYDANGNRIKITDALGRETVLTYNANDFFTGVTDPLGHTTSYGYDAADHRVSVTDPRGHTTEFSYDAANRLTGVTDALGQNTAFAYDAQGNLITKTDPLGHTTGWAYDSLNRRISATDALGQTTYLTYDALDRLTQVIDPNNRKTRYSYDGLGRLAQTLDALGGTASYTYDAVGNRTAKTDPNGHTTTYTYDALDRRVAETDPLGHIETYAYDAIGNPIQRTDANGKVTQYGFDAAGRLETIHYPDASAVAFAYDAVGNLVGMTDPLGGTAFAYDGLNRLVQQTDPYAQTVAYEYDAAGNRVAVVYPDGKRVTYAYDALNRMQSVTDWLGGVTTYAYDGAGRLTGAVNPNSTVASYAYDAAYRLTQLINFKPDQSVLAGYNLTLDPFGNRTAIDRTEPLAPVFGPEIDSYSYDDANRLANLNGSAISHDPNGNLLSKPGATFEFDVENRLIRVNDVAAATYRYDGLGHRLAAERNHVPIRYTLDLSKPLSDVLVESDSTGKPQAYYVYGLGLIARIAPNGEARYYHYDPIGSTVALTDLNGQITDTYTYDPFGQVMNLQQSTDNPFRFVGQFGVMDEGFGLNYARARYYSPELGRFFGQDLLRGSLSNGQTLNRYVYALNNPVRLVDVSGLSTKEGGLSEASFESSDGDHNNLLPERPVGAVQRVDADSANETGSHTVWKAAKWLGQKATSLLGFMEKADEKSYGAGLFKAGYTAIDMYKTHGQNQALVKSGEVAEEFSTEREIVNHLLNFGLSVGVGGQANDLMGGAVEKNTMRTLDKAVFNRSRDICLQAGEASNCLQ
jgi:RHS repeat-associated protein